MITTGYLPHCCVGKIFSNFGGAHGVRIWKDFDEFCKDIYRFSPGAINIALLTNQQLKAKEFLKESGWTEGETCGHMTVFSISGNNFQKKKHEWRKKAEEERIRKIKEVVPEIPAIPRFRNVVRMNDVYEIFQRELTIDERQEVFLRLYGVHVSMFWLGRHQKTFHALKTLVANRRRAEMTGRVN